jgi:membrane-associated protein
MTITALGPAFLDPQHLAQTFGLLGILAIVFAECGLLVGFFLPGDSLLFAAGLLVAGNVFHQPLWWVILLICIAAIAGNICGYFIGRAAGPAVFSRPESRFFKPEYVDRTQAFFDRYGGAAIILARFTPIVRTFIPVMAGTGRMAFPKFAVFSVIGGLLWGTSMTLLGYFLGQFTWVQKNLELIALLVVALSMIPIWLEVRRRNGETTEPAN